LSWFNNAVIYITSTILNSWIIRCISIIMKRPISSSCVIWYFSRYILCCVSIYSIYLVLWEAIIITIELHRYSKVSIRWYSWIHSRDIIRPCNLIVTIIHVSYNWLLVISSLSCFFYSISFRRWISLCFL